MKRKREKPKLPRVPVPRPSRPFDDKRLKKPKHPPRLEE